MVPLSLQAYGVQILIWMPAGFVTVDCTLLSKI